MPLANAEAVVARVRTVNPSALVVLDTHEDWVGPVRDRLLTLARSVDVFVPSAEELTELTGCDEPADGLAVLAADGLRRAVVKAGGRGAYVLEDGHVWHVPATTGPVDDTTGAGDSFCGALVAALASARSLSDAARAGCATAGVAIAASGSTRLLERADAASAVVAAAAGLEVRDLGPVATEPRSPDTYDIDVMRREILTIPDVVASTVADPTGAVHALAESLVAAGTEHLWLTGCGDSAFAGAAAVLALRRDGGLSARAVHALDLARYETRYLPAGSVVVALSFSGRVGRTTEAAVQARRFGHRVVALTNDPDGPLARASDDVLPVDVPTLGFSPGTSTYVGMLATLLALAAQVAAVRGDPGPAERLAALPAMAETTLTSSLDAARAAAGLMLGHQWVAFLGGGPNEATARFGAAKLFEGPQLVGHPTNLEEWAHEEYFVTRPGDPVVLVAPSGASYDRAGEILDELRFVGARPIVVSDLDPGDGVLHLPLATGAPEHLSPLLACLPLALTGFHLARLSGKRSYNFASEAARVEHYETIHRATVGEPA